MEKQGALAGIVWDARRRVYLRNGRALSAKQLRAVRDAAADQVESESRLLLGQLFGRQITRAAWLLAMQGLIRAAARLGWLLGSGGVNAGAPEGELHNLTDHHLTALNGFLQAVTDEQMANPDAHEPSPALLARAASYGAALLSAFAAGKSAAWGAGLPIEPPLHPYCRCSVDYQADGDGRVLATWIAQANCCRDCDDAAATYRDYDTGATINDEDQPMSRSIERKHHCPTCGRFLTAMHMPEDFERDVLRARLHCRTCGKWCWFDAVAGAQREDIKS